MTQSIKDQFIAFLKKEGVYTEFMREFEMGIGRIYSFNNLIEEALEVEDLIFMAFNPASTEKGSKYWCDISDKWQAHLKGEE